MRGGIAGVRHVEGGVCEATGVQEAIYTMLMMQNSFIGASINIDEPDEAIGDIYLELVELYTDICKDELTEENFVEPDMLLMIANNE